MDKRYPSVIELLEHIHSTRHGIPLDSCVGVCGTPRTACSKPRGEKIEFLE